MRHHVHEHASSNVQMHPCLSQVYNFSTNPTNIVARKFNFILAALFLTEIVNASLATTNLYNEKLDVFKHREVLRKGTDDISSLFSTMNSYACFPGLATIIETLGNFFT